MPVIVDYRVCDNSPACSAVRVCPRGTLTFNHKENRVEADNEKCHSCAGPCARVCPAGAIKWYKTMDELEAAKVEMESSTLSKDDLLEQRYGVRPGDPRELGPNLHHVDCSNFQSEVLESDIPVVVDFWAEWCAPCRILAPTFKSLAAKYEGKVKFGKLDTEECMEVPGEYVIMSIPTMLFFHKGQVVDQAVGALPAEAIQRKLDAIVARTSKGAN